MLFDGERRLVELFKKLIIGWAKVVEKYVIAEQFWGEPGEHSSNGQIIYGT